ncbi:GNAT family N-acetyltransferase [Trebonia kvetii]|uniref:GNAT family N-acetyltransferase n=1 Tax=Trebonia kvetii TaxID=2480626 RepID=UPI0016529A7D|nr:GNAT family N-acetyltransferase [Trebonia kvetii]
MSSELRSDAEILHDAMREAVSTSPHSFLRTRADIEAVPPDVWVDEIRSSRWAVAQQLDGSVVGVAASKRPNPAVDSEDPATSRYIESVWIHPRLRRKLLGERLIKYLFAAEYCTNQHIRQFVLWVYATNAAAMRLYEHIGFERTPERNVERGVRGTRTEIKYRLDFDPEVHTTVSLVAGRGRRHHQLHRGVTYRVLGQSGG